MPHTDGTSPSEGGSPEQNFLAHVLAGTSSGASDAAREAKLERQVSDAVATLDAVKQEVINRRFGLGGSKPESYATIAESLTGRLSPELRKELAEIRGCTPDTVAITATDVQDMETQALRDLRSPGSQS